MVCTPIQQKLSSWSPCETSFQENSQTCNDLILVLLQVVSELSASTVMKDASKLNIVNKIIVEKDNDDGHM